MNYKSPHNCIETWGGLKSKVESLAELVEDQKPPILSLVEEHLQIEEEVTIPEYGTIYS